MEDLQGAILKGYKLEERIGSGGFGAVYRAKQTTIGREVAVKIILPGFANSPDFIRRFESEAHLIARLEHPHITPLYDFWRDPTGAYLVMRHLRGGSVRDSLATSTYELRAVSHLLDQVASALDFAHRNNVIHRDIKPGNILLDEDGNSYLADFGIAKDLAGVNESNTAADAVVGSLDYISPEQARSEPVTPRTDIYSLGVSIYEIISGEHPFKNATTIERLYKHINEPLPFLMNVPDKCCDILNEVIQKATAKNPADRYADVLTLAVAFREGIGLTTVSDETIVEQLTMREHEILSMVIKGMSNREIADELVVTLATVKWHINQVYKKLGVRSRVQAIVRARELNLIVTGDTVDFLTGANQSLTEISLPEPENPYKGLHAFQMNDARDFFGRDDLVKKIIDRMCNDDPYHHFLTIVGPSGSGKSSLVKAGLIPALWKGAIAGSEKWFVVDMIPGTRPLDKLEIALMRVSANQSQNLRDQLQRDEHGLSRVADLILPDDDSELVIVVDQFEEVFTLVEDDTVRQHFLDLLRAAVSNVRTRVRVIITLRADYYDRPLHYPEFGELIRNRMETVLPLSAKGLERAVRGPAERVGVTFEQGLVEQIVSSMNYQAGALPLLQYALTELFDRRSGRLLTHTAYQQIGGAVGALANRADEIFRSLSEDAQHLAQQVFLRLVTLGEGAEDTRRRATQAELFSLTDNTDLMEELIDQFAAYRLLSLDHDPETRHPTVEVAHEAILREWDRLRQWLNESRDDIRQERLIAQAADAWKTNSRDKSYLLSGTRLKQAENWRETTTFTLTPKEHEYIQASIEDEQAQQRAEVERHAREQAQEQRSQTLLRMLVAVFAVAAIIAVGLSLFALNQSSIAQAERDNAEVAQVISDENAEYARGIALASAAKSAHVSNNPDQALALAVAAYTSSENPSAYVQSVLYETAFTPATRRIYTGETRSFAVSPDGHSMLSWKGTDSSLVLWDIESAEILQQLPVLMADRQISQVIFAPDGKTAFALVASSDLSNGQVIQFEVASGEVLQRFVTPDNGFSPRTIELSPDSQTLLTATGIYSDDFNFIQGPIFALDVLTGNIIRQFADLPVDVPYEPYAITFSKDGQRALVGSDASGALVLWDVTTGEVIRTFGPTEEGRGIILGYFTSAGILTLVSDRNTQLTTTAALWDAETGQKLQQQTWTSLLNKADLNPDGHSLAFAFTSSSVDILDVQSWQMTRRLYGHGGPLTSVTFMPDGRSVMSASSDGDIRLWNLEEGSEIMRLEGLTNAPAGFIVSPEGQTAVSQQYLGPFMLWNLETGELIRQLGETSYSSRSVAFSPDGRYVVSGSTLANPCPQTGTEITLTDISSGNIVWQTSSDNQVSAGLAFINDGRQIATVDSQCSNNVIIWDATNGMQVAEWEGHQTPSSGVSGSHDGSLAATASRDGTAILWDAITGSVLHTLQHGTSVRTVAFSPDDRHLLTTDDNALLRLWDVGSGKMVRQLLGHTSGILFVDFSPDGRYLASSGRDNNLFIWDLQTGAAVRHFQLEYVIPLGHVVAFSPDGRSIYINDENNEILLVNLMLEPGELLNWVTENRYVRDLTCSERDL